MVVTKQCWCSKCKKDLDISICRDIEGVYYCPYCDKKLMAELIRFKTDIKTIEFGTKLNGQKYTIRTNRNAYLSPEQWIAFFDKLNDRQKLSMMFLIHTGGRIFEVQHLMPENIVGKLLTFETTKKRSARGERRCKPREVGMSTVFIDWYKTLDMKKVLRKDGCFDIMSDAGLNILLKKVLRENNVKTWYMYSVHNIRKTHENWMLAQGFNIQKVANRLGHMIGTAMSTYVQETIFTSEQIELIKTILGDDIYVTR